MEQGTLANECCACQQHGMIALDFVGFKAWALAESQIPMSPRVKRYDVLALASSLKKE